MPTIAQERPAYVTFEKLAVEDRAATLTDGQYRTKDVEYVFVTPPGSKDRIPREVSVWLQELDNGVREERMDPRTVEQYKQMLELWRRGQELPLFGTPIRGWTVLSPAQQKNVLAANILTVEDLATANGEAMARIGMGAQELRTRAITWLESAKNVGVVSLENEKLSVQNQTLMQQVNALSEQVRNLSEIVRKYAPAAAQAEATITPDGDDA